MGGGAVCGTHTHNPARPKRNTLNILCVSVLKKKTRATLNVKEFPLCS
jgi:hypothetical protein